MKGKAIIPLVLGLVVGLVAVKFGIDAVKSAQGSGQASEQITAVRAKLDIAAFQEITPDLLEAFTTTDPQFAPANERIPKVADAVGRVTAKAIPARAPILASMLAPIGTPPGMVGRIPPGFRAVSVKIDEVSGVAYQLSAGDWVDVTVVMDIVSGRRGAKETVAEVILQRVQVAAVGHGTQDDASAKAPGGRPAKSATLLVPEDEVPKLHLAATRGKLTLSLRGEDEEINDSPPKATDSDLSSRIAQDTADQSGLPRVTKVADLTPIEDAVPHQVIVSRGIGAKNVERLTFESEHSNNLLEVTPGMPTHASSTLRSTPSGRRAAESDFGPSSPNADTSGTETNSNNSDNSVDDFGGGQ